MSDAPIDITRQDTGGHPRHPQGGADLPGVPGRGGPLRQDTAASVPRLLQTAAAGRARWVTSAVVLSELSTNNTNIPESFHNIWRGLHTGCPGCGFPVCGEDCSAPGQLHTAAECEVLARSRGDIQYTAITVLR